MVFGTWLPFSPIGPAFGFTPLPRSIGPFALTLLGYVLLTQVVKTWLFRKGWVSQWRRHENTFLTTPCLISVTGPACEPAGSGT